MQPKTSLELIQQFRNEHVSEYKVFTRTLLTIASGSLALLAGLSETKDKPLPPMLQTGWALLCLSVLFGLAVQWQIVLTPKQHADHISAQQEAPPSDTPTVFRRLPLRRQYPCVIAQTCCFAAAFALLTISVLTR